MPRWVVILEMAEKWSIPPWVLDDSEPQIVWEERFMVMREARIEKENRAANG